MIIRRYINGKKVDIEVNVAQPPPLIDPNTPNQPKHTSSNPSIPAPSRRGCGCKKK